MRRRALVIIVPVLLSVVASALVALGASEAAHHAASAQPGCATSSPASATYSITLCITAPADGATLSGVEDVTITADVSVSDPRVDEYIFYLDGSYLLTDLARSGAFELPTEKFVDGAHTLAVEALMKDDFLSDRASISVTFDNGITEPPVNTNTFTPHTGSPPPAGESFVLAAVGDGASGRPGATQVSDMLVAWQPDVFLYLGDVYEKGSASEFFNWYGTPGRYYGRLRDVTNPTMGNHEFETGNTDGYFDYWDNVPNYYSFNANGWHIFSLNSNTFFNQTAPGTPQYDWLAQELTDSSAVCSLVYFHHPPFSIGNHGNNTHLHQIWSLLAQHDVDIVLAGHEHNYQRWQPLDGAGVPDPQGVTQFVVGGGGKNTTTFKSTDSRVAFGVDTAPDAYGALRLELNQYGAGFRFINIEGATLDSGVIPCSGAPTDTDSPSSPTLAGDSTEEGHIALTWTAAVDNVGVYSYTLSRGGVDIATVAGGQLEYTDNTVQLGSIYTYTVEAADMAGNRSLPSNSVSVLAQSSTLEFGPTDDATIRSSNPTTNLGSEPILEVDGSPLEDTLLRFEITGLGTHTVTSAVLRLYVTDGSNFGGEFTSVTDTAWAEETVTWANAPAADGGLLGTLGSVSTGEWQELDVTPLVSGDGPVSLRANSSSANGANYASKEDPDGRGPQLIVVFDRATGSDQSSPSPPANLVASEILTSHVALTWDTSSDNVGVVGYSLFRDGGLLTAIGAHTYFTDTGVAPETTYQYFVRARDAAGNISDPSNTITVTTPAVTTGDLQPTPPYRLAFYYPWFPNAWTQKGVYPYTNYNPLLGFYSSGDANVIEQHIEAMQYGGIEGAIVSWWGQGHHTDLRIPTILSATAESDFRWAVYYEQESQKDPTVDELRDDLAYLKDTYGADPAYFRINGRPVIFVYANSSDGCSMADRWTQANDVNAYLVLKVFPGYRDCASQPDGWHQYAPAVDADDQGDYSYTISPGFWKVGEEPRLTRELHRWRKNVRDMIGSGATFHLVTTFNEWGEGTSTEAAMQWETESGYGAYLDALHDDGQPPTFAVTPTTYLPFHAKSSSLDVDEALPADAGNIVERNDLVSYSRVWVHISRIWQFKLSIGG